ncbi:hypothetical protein DPMN_102289 [Dreissena polymorpha]|uniref:Uncharacterized protein n=1 Tax=Dreissena polymorpha TaxID=45954 RepID=A0A9D4LKD7_DREPO|nr:hypothetical protein DPMN_102289 [Dreissena polymorpha]
MPNVARVFRKCSVIFTKKFLKTFFLRIRQVWGTPFIQVSQVIRERNNITNCLFRRNALKWIIVLKVRFTNTRQKRNYVMSNRKVCKGSNIFINEDLTNSNQKMLMTIKKALPENEAVWSWDGKLYHKTTKRYDQSLSKTSNSGWEWNGQKLSIGLSTLRISPLLYCTLSKEQCTMISQCF